MLHSSTIGLYDTNVQFLEQVVNHLYDKILVSRSARIASVRSKLGGAGGVAKPSDTC